MQSLSARPTSDDVDFGPFASLSRLRDRLRWNLFCSFFFCCDPWYKKGHKKDPRNKIAKDSPRRCTKSFTRIFSAILAASVAGVRWRLALNFGFAGNCMIFYAFINASSRRNCDVLGPVYLPSENALSQLSGLIVGRRTGDKLIAIYQERNYDDSLYLRFSFTELNWRSAYDDDDCRRCWWLIDAMRKEKKTGNKFLQISLTHALWLLSHSSWLRILSAWGIAFNSCGSREFLDSQVHSH